jgi:hypothetical protein
MPPSDSLLTLVSKVQCLGVERATLIFEKLFSYVILTLKVMFMSLTSQLK